MATLGEFLHILFDEGRIVLKGRPLASDGERASALAVLVAEFERHRLDIAGDPIAFDPVSALKAAETLRASSWFLVNRSEPVETLERSLVLPPPPKTASEHLSADLSFRFLPPIQRRARAIAPEDRLSKFLAELLRNWPLSGVLSDLVEGPTEVGDLGGHPGLWLLYAERLAIDEKPAWMVAPRACRAGVSRAGQGVVPAARSTEGGRGGSWLTKRSRSSGTTWSTISNANSWGATRWST
jgi:hypothetical protein